MSPVHDGARDEAAQRWFGYGRWAASYWFVGMEPGGTDEHASYESWVGLGACALIDCRDRRSVRVSDPDQVLRAVGRRVAELRKAGELTQEKLAEEAKVSVKYLQRVEAGRENLTLRSLVRIANLLKVVPVAILKPPRSTARGKTGRPPRRAARDR